MNFSNIDSLTAYFSLLMAQLSLLRERKSFQWISFGMIAIILALSHSLITPIAFIPLFALLSLHIANQRENTTLTRLLVLTSIFALSFSLIHHLWPSFQNLTVSIAPPQKIIIPFDTPFASLFLLQWGGLSWWSWKQLQPLARGSAMFLFLSAFLSLTAGVLIGVLHFQPLWGLLPYKAFFLHALFALLPEEIFCRGFIQREIFYTISPNSTGKSLLALLLTVVLSVLALFPAQPCVRSLVILTGIQFTTGTIYQKTLSLEIALLYRMFIQAILFFVFQWL